MVDKITLRKQYLAKRKLLPPAAINLLLTDMLPAFGQLPFSQNPMIVLSYKPILTTNEVAIHWFEQALLQLHPHTQFAYPSLQKDHRFFEAVLPTTAGFKTNSLHFQEPCEGVVVPLPQIDMVWLPLLCFDQKGNRIGYGKGFYDRYLLNKESKALLIGFSFFEATAEITGVAPTDVPLTHCITPKQLYVF